MAGQQQIKRYDRETLLEKHSKKVLREADLYFAEKHFKIQSEYSRDKFLHSTLIKDIMCEDNCEIINFLNKKLRGALGDENIEIVDLKTAQTRYQDINNYYITNNSQGTWSKTDW
jgi:hypothetical protein